MSSRYPQYYAVNGRPVKFVELADGGLEVLAWDYERSELVPSIEFLSQVSDPSKEVARMTEAEFDALLKKRREERRP